MTVTRIWLIRHGAVEARGQSRCYGRLNVALSSEGLAQIASVADRLSQEPLSAIYASPLLRTTQSAELIAAPHGLAVRREEALREMHFGDFEGRTYDEIAASHPEIYQQWMTSPTDVQFPGGECFREMQNRVLQLMEQIRRAHAGSTVAIVTHGGVNRIVLAAALHLDNPHIFHISQKYAAVNLVSWLDGFATVDLMNA